MSLHKFAEQVAAHGRGDDSLLVHMTPDEVKRLQAFAEANGRTLTINPETGLPEAGFLSDLFKAVAPIALGAFLGPAGAAIGGGFMSAGMAGLTVGGLTTLATGSLSRGLMAGLGAYGGAGLGESLAGAGANAMTTANVGDYASSLAERGIYPTLESGAVNPAFGEEASKLALNAQKQAFAAPLTERLSAGLGAITESPSSLGSFAKQNLGNIAAAATPIMAGAMVPTTTQAPTQDTGNIRKFSFDPIGQRYTPLGVFPAAGYKGMAGGGIVALANGGAIKMADGTPPAMLTDEQLFQKTGSWEAAAAARDAQNNALNAYNWQQQAAARDAAANAANQSNWQQQANAANAANAANLNTAATNYVASAATPNETAAQFITGANQAGIGLTQPLATALQNSGLSAAAQYALTHADIGPAENVAETYGGLKGLSNNILYDLAAYNADPRNKNKSAGEKRADALAAMNQWGLNEADVKRATGMSLSELFPTTTTVTPTGVYGTYGNNTGNVLTRTPGDIGANPDGTVTVFPNIPGRPPGGFTGMGQVKDVYTAGGGSLGQNNLFVPKTEAELYARYGNTGGSQQAYDYLMGKGAVDIKKPVTPTGEIMRPYNEAVMGVPAAEGRPTQKYIFQGGKYVLNPNYKELSFDSKGNRIVGGTSTTGANTTALTAAKTINVVNNRGETEIATLSADGNYYTSGGDAYDVAGKQVVAKADGGMAYSVGGGLGSLGSYSDGGRLLKGPGDGVADSIPATIGAKQQPARLADGEFVVPARIVSELGNGSTEAGAKKLYAMMDRVQKARGKTTGKNKVAANTKADKYLPA